MYPCFYVALGLLAKRRLREMRIGMWLDGSYRGTWSRECGGPRWYCLRILDRRDGRAPAFPIIVSLALSGRRDLC